MKDNIDYLKELREKGIENISNKTYISRDSIEAILDKNFAYFDNQTKSRKFVGIIESAFSIDLSEWLREYNEHFNIGESTSYQPSDQIIDTIDISPIKEKNYLLLFSVFSLGFLILYFLYGKLFSSSEVYIEADNSNISQQVNIKKLKKVINKIEKTDAKEETLTAISIDKNRHKKKISEEEIIYNELNPDIESILDEDIIIDLNKSILNISDNNLSITTNLGRVWIGIIDASTYDKKSDIVNGSKSYLVFDNTIIITGHGHITLSSGEEFSTVRKGKKQYFYYKDKNFVKLTHMEYLFLNKGIEW